MSIETGIGHARTRVKTVLVAFCALLALGSFGFHATRDYLNDPAAGRIGVALVLLSLAGAAALLTGLPGPPESDGPSLSRLDLYALLGALALAFVLYLVGIRSTGPWSEETWWIEQAKGILSGTNVHPAGFKDDHPANFQAWPVALFLLVTRDPLLSVRLPGVIYALGTACFCAGTVQTLRPGSLLTPTFVLSACGFTLLYYSHSGWNEMSIVPFLVSGQLHFLARVASGKDPRALLPLVFFVAFGFWTLYTPFVFALIVLGDLALLPPSRLATRHKLLFALAFLLIAAPTIGKAVRYPTNAVTRHEEFLKGGEWGRTFDQNYRPLPTYARNAGKALYHMLPTGGPIEEWDLTGINLEGTTSALAALGLLAALRFSWLNRGFFFGSFSLLLLGYVLSNPQASLWRELCLIPFPLVLAGLGFSLVVDVLRRWPGGRWLAPAVGGTLIAVHLGIWGQRFEWLRSSYPGDPLGEAILAIHAEVHRDGREIPRVAVLATTGGLASRYYDELELLHRPPSVELGRLEDLQAILGNRQANVIVAVREETSPSPEALEALLTRSGIGFTRKEVLDRVGRQAGWVFFLS